MSAENYPISIKFVMQMKIFIPRCTFYKENDFSDSRWRTDAMLKIVFGHISPPYWPINAKFGSKMKNHVLIQVTSQIGNFCKLKMADNRHFENNFMSISQP